MHDDDKDYRLVQLANSPNWYIEWREDGRPVRRSTRCRDKKAAARFLTAFLREVSKADALAGTIPDVLDYYFENHAKALASAEQAAIYISHLKRIIGAIRPEELTLEVQASYLRTRRAEHIRRQEVDNLKRKAAGKPQLAVRPISDETLNSELTRLSAAIRLYYDWKNIQFAPPRVKLLKRKQPRDKWLTRSQLAALMWQLRKGGRPSEHLLLFMRLGRYSGPRPGQITSLPWARVDFDSRAIWYFDPDEAETNKRAEVVDMDDGTYRMLKSAYTTACARAESAGRAPPVNVIEYKGRPVAKVHKAFKRHITALGWSDVTPNTLRHTFATHAARRANEVDMSLMDLMRAMGHSSIKTTMRYAKHMPGQHRKVLQAARKK